MKAGDQVKLINAGLLIALCEWQQVRGGDKGGLSEDAKINTSMYRWLCSVDKSETPWGDVAL